MISTIVFRSAENQKYNHKILRQQDVFIGQQLKGLGVGIEQIHSITDVRLLSGVVTYSLSVDVLESPGIIIMPFFP